MTIEAIYKDLLTKQYISDYIAEQLDLDEVPSVDDLGVYLEDTFEDMDLSVPQFDSEDFKVTSKETSSAGKFNETFLTIYQDLQVLYTMMMLLSETTIKDFERWKFDIEILEKRLTELCLRLDNLLLLSVDTEGYHSFFEDRFTSFTYIDLDLTDTMIDIIGHQVYLSPLLASGQKTTQIVFTDLKDDQDVTFKIRNSYENITYDGGKKTDIFTATSTGWGANILAKKDITMVCELTIKLGEEAIDLTSIYLKVHANEPITVTPMLSLDNYNYVQLPVEFPSELITDTFTFNFLATSTKYVKFLLTSDGVLERNLKRYSFGFTEIAFYEESFTTNEYYNLYSKPIFILDKDQEVKEFSKVTLEVEENVPAETEIKYFVTVNDDSLVPIDGSTKWYPISPKSHEAPAYPKVLDFSDVEEIEIGNEENITISYDSLASDQDYINPAYSFHLLSKNTDDSVLDELITSSSIRYAFSNEADRILNYQIKDSDYTGSGTGTKLSIDEDNFVIYRNVGEKGLTQNDTVRSIQRGWRFEDPYYICVVEILNNDGLFIDIGEKSEIIIDEVKSYGRILLSGKTDIFNGLHEVRVNKNYWKHVTPGLNSLEELEEADSLYPYNHKLLIEGYDYGATYSGFSPKIYTGVDKFFECRMKKISHFDFISNIRKDDYIYYATDQDASDTHTDGNNPTKIILVKSGKEYPDSINEKFILKFNLINQRYKYLKFKASLATENGSITPSLNSYRIKFGD